MKNSQFKKSMKEDRRDKGKKLEQYKISKIMDLSLTI